MNKSFWIAALKRCGHTVAQTAIGMIGTAIFVQDVDWIAVLSASALAGILSILKSIAIGVPEVQIEERKPPDEADCHITVKAYEHYDENGDPVSDEKWEAMCASCDLTPSWGEEGANDGN